MPLPFLPGHDSSVIADRDDLLVAATVDGRVFVSPDGTLPTVATLPDLDVLHIGVLHGRPVWAGELAVGADGVSLRSWLALTAELPVPVAAAVARGYYQVRWRHTNRHCGECGGELQDRPGFTTRRCPKCSTLRHVPNAMSPVVVVAVEHDDRLLLVRQTYGPYQHEWDLVAGFVEPGETLEGAAVRELWEETGLVPMQLAYTGSHPWSFSGPSVLLVGFSAVVADPDLRLDPGEIAEARWFSRAELRNVPVAELPSFPYTMSLIHRFLDA
ncbi:NAD(+) diphosphatase [Catellatospora sichuanensis]|uniref:NAD(+) diphosphatase n=1 Tax=Catellatospora sichuanensis TaxID=1969805 RepID=UPI001182334D|nr:NUDIX domain-containing protein [Catellatospora sichuanensis]